jgi:predicted O-methyltransferase YrrM
MKDYIVKGFKYAKFSIRSRGVKYFCGEVLYYFSSRILKKYLHPSLADFYFSGFEVKFNGRDVFDILRNRISNKTVFNAVDQFETEYDVLHANLQQRLTDPIYEIDVESSKLLYMLVRLISPECVVETGVANGVSTFFILNAMRNNGIGKLTSIDISYDVATFLNNEEKMRWELKVLDTKANPSKQFKEILAGVKNLSIYLHDGDHSYLWQQMEYYSSLTKLNCCGILLSDDVDSSFAFIDTFGKSASFETESKGILLGKNKIFGYAVKKC